jgi:ribosome-associated translation inhibitor RaiA
MTMEGRKVQQRGGEDAMVRQRTPALAEIQVVVRGEVPQDCVEHARTMVGKVASQIREPVPAARVKLSQGCRPAMRHPAVAQVNLSVDGTPTRAHVAADTMHEAIDLLQDRLTRRLERLHELRQAHRSGTDPGQQRPRHHGGDHPLRQEPQASADEEPGEVVRHKSYSLARETPDEAILDLETLDYGFHLFTDAESGQDSVVYRSGPTGYRLARLNPGPAPAGPSAAPLTLSGTPAPQLTLAEAQRRLALTGDPFVFFADRESGRGNVLYRRLDGHHGVITPVR